MIASCVKDVYSEGIKTPCLCKTVKNYSAATALVGDEGSCFFVQIRFTFWLVYCIHISLLNYAGGP